MDQHDAPPADRFVSCAIPTSTASIPAGRQLPYIDRVILRVAEGKLIPAKTGAGEATCRRATCASTTTRSSRRARSATTTACCCGRRRRLADRAVPQPQRQRSGLARADARRAVPPRAVARDRPHEINQVIYFGLAQRRQQHGRCRKARCIARSIPTRWAKFDLKAAERCWTRSGLTKRDAGGLRLLPDGRPLEIIVETAGEGTEETDVLELIRDSWREVGMRSSPGRSQREVFRNRVFSGETMMSVWSGLENGMPSADMSPDELAPTRQQQLQWPKWGQYFETSGKAGEAPDMPEAKELFELLQAWRDRGRAPSATDLAPDARDPCRAASSRSAWSAASRSRSSCATRCATCRTRALYNWDPGALFGIYRPDTFWFATIGAGGARMLSYMVRRLLMMIPTLLAISIVMFVIIQLPPGDYLTNYIAELQARAKAATGEDRVPARAVRPRQADDRAVRRVGRHLAEGHRAAQFFGPAARRLRLFVRVQPAGRARSSATGCC